MNFSSHLLFACAALVVFFFGLVLYPRLTLHHPVHTRLFPGRAVTFYSLSRAARMAEPGRFRLREDGRSYRFYLTTEQPLKDLAISLGSPEGEYDFAVRLFDEPLARGRTNKDIQVLELKRPFRYELGKRSFYTITLELGRDENVRPELFPYHFEIAPE